MLGGEPDRGADEDGAGDAVHPDQPPARQQAAGADGKRDAQRTPQSREALFAEFLAWRDRQEAMTVRNDGTAETRPVVRSSKSRK